MGSNEFITTYYFPPQLGDAPKARVQAPTVSEDEDSTDLIVPDGEGGASVGDK